ncbi:uncharacterized protein GGS22DRAFT_182911 [Annulohypoxylon maeteangense]|uniref:uncharacterized protein n=1 Tax=Annulohypoxylon maeteangense TaxID=1927788 RepID=UPI00200877A9|nr:uncharacterized protein GGS22DRAFT_182911 [Annulohypoxylon maeteangense]KAI0889568.1 hypothetical protein GGS22DRAFT_182911 [Annulohypoxylon maeteangense]
MQQQHELDLFFWPELRRPERDILVAMEKPWVANMGSSMAGWISEHRNMIRFDCLSPLELLPPEIKLMILNFCDPQSAFNVAFTGPIMYRFVRLNEARIGRHIVCRDISPDLRCLAAGRYWIDKFGYPAARGEAGERRTSGKNIFTETFLIRGLNDDRVFDIINPHSFYGNFQFSLGVARTIISFHDKIRYFASTLAENAVNKGPLPTRPLSNGDPTAPHHVTQVSPGELRRFIKALYIFDVASVVLPYVEFLEPSNPQYAIWHNFWEKFSPWEQQQVRCVQQMLEDWVDHRVAQQGGYTMSLTEGFIQAQFVIDKGVPGLWELRTDNAGRVETQIKDFLDNRIFNTLPPRGEITMRGMDEYWLDRDEVVDEVSLDATYLLNFYDDEDIGPRDSWIHTLLENRIYHRIFRSGYFQQFSCESCMTKWGYIFWDRSKLEWHSSNTMPSGEEMVKVAVDAVLQHDTFRRAEWGRQKGVCTNCTWSTRVKAESGI